MEIKCTFGSLQCMESALCVVLTQYMLVPSSRQEIEFLNIETREVEGTVIYQ